MPPLKHTCTACQRSYQGPAGSIAGTCGSCQEINARNDALAFQQAEAANQRVQSKHKLFMFIGGLVVVASFAVFKFGMKSQLHEDLAQGAGHKSYDDYKQQRDTVYPSDAYSQRVHSLARDMCFCKDLYARTHSPSDDASEASAKADLAKLADCQNAIETGGAPVATP